MLHYFAASLYLNGGSIANSRIVVTVGDDCEPRDLSLEYPWVCQYQIEFVWLDRELFRQKNYAATAIERFRYPFKAQMVMMIDADTFMTNSFADIIHHCMNRQVFGGVIAHVSPWPDRSQPWWNEIFSKAGLRKQHLQYEHTGFGAMTHNNNLRFCPAYFNLGVLIGSASQMSNIGSTIYKEINVVDSIVDNGYRCQIALTLALTRLRIKTLPLPLKYNFPNDECMAEKHHNDLRDVYLFHYLRAVDFDKKRDFADYDAVSAFLARTDVTGVNLEMQTKLNIIHQHIVQNNIALREDI